jgi:hypothetical protein
MAVSRWLAVVQGVIPVAYGGQWNTHTELRDPKIQGGKVLLETPARHGVFTSGCARAAGAADNGDMLGTYGLRSGHGAHILHQKVESVSSIPEKLIRPSGRAFMNVQSPGGGASEEHHAGSSHGSPGYRGPAPPGSPPGGSPETEQEISTKRSCPFSQPGSLRCRDQVQGFGIRVGRGPLRG